MVKSKAQNKFSSHDDSYREHNTNASMLLTKGDQVQISLTPSLAPTLCNEQQINKLAARKGNMGVQIRRMGRKIIITESS